MSVFGNLGGGGGGMIPIQLDEGPGEEDQVENNESVEGGDDDEAEAEVLALFSELDPEFEGQEDEEDEEEEEETPKPKKSAKPGGKRSGSTDTAVTQEQLRNEIVAAINGIVAGEDMIPEDFDPADSKQLRSVLGKSMQHSVAHAVQIALKPMQAALMHARREIERTMDERISAATEGLQSQSLLTEMIPEVNDPKVGAVVRMMDRQLRQQGKKPLARVQSIRKALDTLGLSKKGKVGAGGSRQRRNGDDSPGPFKTGDAALDGFVPLAPRKR